MLLLGASQTYAQTDVTDTYITNADFSSTDGWTASTGGGSEVTYGMGKIGTLTINNVTSLTDETHTADMYCAGVSARWENRYAAYQQTTSTELPAGVYTLSYDIENPGGSSSYNMTNLFYVTVGETTTYDAAATAANFAKLSGNTWESHSISFEVSEASAITISLGYKNVDNQGSGVTPELFISNLKLAKYKYDYTALQAAIAEANTLNGKVKNGVASLTSAIETAKVLLDEATSQDDIDEGVTTLNGAIEAAEPIVAARQEAYGYYKKYTTLNTVIGDENQTDAIAALNTLYEKADATEEIVNEAIMAVTLLNGYQSLNIGNGTFDNCTNFDENGENKGTMIDPATSDKPYIWEIKDWTWDGTFNATAAHVNAAYYGTTLADVNKGTNNTNPPATDMFGKSDGQALHMSSGWSDMARLTQSVKLPAGKYVFYYEAYNANTSATGLDANYFGVRELREVPTDVKATSEDPSAKLGSENVIYANENTKTFASGEWTASAMSFTLNQNEDDAKVAIGLIGGNGDLSQGSGAAAKLWIDNVEVYYIAAEMETYTRTKTTSGYGTICLPYKAAPADNVTVYEIASVDDTENPTTLYLSEVESMAAGTPYIYCAATDGAAADAVFTQTSTVTVDAPVAGANNLTGVFTSAAGTVANDAYILSGGTWYKVDNSSEFNLGDNRAYISSFSGMTVYSEEESSENVKAMSITNDDATAISGISKGVAAEGAIYTLSGQRVNNVSKGGLYIVNGKKVWMK